MFSHPDYDGHEALLFTKDAASGLRALIAIHDTTLGPAFGGCRMYPYASEQHAMTDVLRLSRGMTYKAAICELPYGGGKSVMIADPRRDKTPALLHAMGRIIEGLGGRYITADDVGTTLADLIIMREVTCHTAGATAAAQQALPATAFGVFEALRAAAEVCLGRSDLEGLRVAVQGLGNVGMPLCGYLAAAGAAVASGSWWKLPMAAISGDDVSAHATRSRICSAGATFRVLQPSTFRSVICPLANNAQNSMQAVS